MKRDGKYRFSLQFPALTEQQIKVGDALERMGNRKSNIIVDAVSKYIDAHPELIASYSSSRSRKKSLKNGPRLITSHSIKKQQYETNPTNCDSSEACLVSMLDNLSLFH